MSGDRSRQAREATDGAVLTALRDAGDTGMMPGDLATALPSITTRTISRSLIRLSAAGQIRRDSERGRVYALPINDDGATLSQEDVFAEAAATRTRFRAQRDSAIQLAEQEARSVDLRLLHPTLRHLAVAKRTWLLNFAETLRQCDTPEKYDAVDRAFDEDFRELQDKYAQALTQLNEEEARKRALEEQKREWQRQNEIAARQTRALPPGHSTVITRHKPGKKSRRNAKMSIHKTWMPTYGQVLLPQPAPGNAPDCKFCSWDQYRSPAMYLVASPALGTGGVGLCDRHAEGERYAPDTHVYLIKWK